MKRTYYNFSLYLFLSQLNKFLLIMRFRISRIKTSFIVAFVALLLFESKAQTPKFVNEFLNIGVGARSHGMFGSVIASSNDITGAFWNPASLSKIDVPFQASAMHAEWFAGIAKYDYIAFGKQFNKEKHSFGAISIIRMGIDQIPNTLSLIGPDGSINYDNVLEFSAADYAFILSFGKALGSEKIRIGGSAKIIHRSIGSFASAWGFGFDLGALFISKNFTLALMGKDITSTFNSWSFNLTEEEKAVFIQTGNDIPVSSTEIALPRIIFGIAYHKISGKYSYIAELDLNFSTNGLKSSLIASNKFSVDPTFGIEVGYNEQVFIRAGIGNIQRIINDVNVESRSISIQPNIGLGINLGRFKIDYALANVGSVSGTLFSHIFSHSRFC